MYVYRMTLFKGLGRPKNSFFFVKVQIGFYCPIDWVTCEWVALKLEHSNCKGQKSLFLEVFFVFLVQFAGLFIAGHSKQQVRDNYFFWETSSIINRST